MHDICLVMRRHSPTVYLTHTHQIPYHFQQTGQSSSISFLVGLVLVLEELQSCLLWLLHHGMSLGTKIYPPIATDYAHL